MVFINKISSFLLNVMQVKVPAGVWEKIIMWFHSGIANYGWAIIVFTLVVKLVMLPLDFFNRKITEKNTKVQAVIQPEIEKIQKQYGNNKQMVNQKTMEVYKKHNYNVTGSCFFMIINLGLTFFIFITLFAGLNSMAAYKVGYQYQEMETTYNYYVEETEYENFLTKYEEFYQEEITELLSEGETPADATTEQKEIAETKAKERTEDFFGKTEEEILTIIHQAVAKTYNEVKDSWLWISNIWRPDTPWKKSNTTFKEFVSMAKIQYKTELKEGQEESFKIRLEENKEKDEIKYNAVVKAIENQNRANGYLIIPLLAMATTVLSLLATQGNLKKKKDRTAPNPATGGIFMVVLMGGLMGYITLTYNSVFAIYITIGSIFGLATTPLINIGIKKLNEWQEKNRLKKTKKENYKR